MKQKTNKVRRPYKPTPFSCDILINHGRENHLLSERKECPICMKYFNNLEERSTQHNQSIKKATAIQMMGVARQISPSA